MKDEGSMQKGSLVIHGGQRPEATTGAVMPPISLSATYVQSSPGEHLGFEYSRSHNPTRYAFERMMASLEGSPVTEAQDPSRGAFAFASGLAATATTLDLLASGERLLAMDDLYGGTRRLFSFVRERSAGLRFDYVDMSVIERFSDAMTVDTAMVWVETPTNPTMKMVDLTAVANIARAANPDVILVCDNTFASPLLQQPLAHGFDISMHSSTKYLNGHSDVVGGVLVTANAQLAERVRYLQNAVGAVLPPFDAYLTLRGIKTLDVRMRRHSDNAMALARFLDQHDGVTKVYYPGLESHPQYQLCQRQMSAPGGMISIELDGGLEAAKRFATRLEVFQLAESLGAVESLVNHPAIMTHASVPEDIRQQLGITDGLVRLSVGIEACDDLLHDVEQALS